MSTPTPRALALREEGSLLMAAITAHRVPPGPLLEATLAVREGLAVLEDREDAAIEAAAGVLGHVWPRAGVRVVLRRAVQVGAVTVEEIAAWVAAQSGGVWLEAESTLGALLDAVEAQESALAEGGERDDNRC